MVGELLFQRGADVSLQVVDVNWHDVGQVGAPRVAPARSFRVKVGRMCRQSLELDVLQSGCSESLRGRSVNVPAIPTDDQWPLALLPNHIGHACAGSQGCSVPSGHRSLEKDGDK